MLNIDQIGRYMVKNGHEFTVLTTTKGYFDTPYNIVRLPFRPMVNRFVEKQKTLLYCRQLLKESFDILHLHTFSPRFHVFNLVFYSVFSIAKFKGVPIVFSLNYVQDNYNETLLQVRFLDMTINGSVLALNDYAAVWDAERSGFLGNLFFELWIYNGTIGAFQYHERFTGLWFNMTS